MQATAAFVIGIAIAGIVLVATRAGGVDSAEPRTKPTALGWLTLAFGLVGVSAFALGAMARIGIGVYLSSIASAFAAVVIGIGALLRRERHWPTWVGLAAGLVPAAGWIAFAVGSVLGIGG